MRAKEFMTETTTSGSIAPVAMPMLQSAIQRRQMSGPAKYANTYSVKKRKQHARG
jgi:hypothetical protein